MLRIRSAVLCAVSGLLLLAGCGSSKDSSGSLSSPINGVGVNPWVMGGQTGALLPPCGLTPAAAAGDSVPGGDSGIVVHTQSCVGFVAAELELYDQNGAMVEFDVENLPGGAILLRPRSPLAAGIYRVKVGGMEMESVVAEEPAALPMQLGTLTPLGPKCGLDVELAVDPLLLPYLPQLKLSVSVDGGDERTWFDYGELDVNGGRALLSLPCGGAMACLPDGLHTLHVTPGLAGELGTLAPVDVTVETRCNTGTSAASASTFSSDGNAREMGCAVTPARRTPAWGRALLGLGILAGLLAVRRVRRSSA